MSLPSGELRLREQEKFSLDRCLLPPLFPFLSPLPPCFPLVRASSSLSHVLSLTKEQLITPTQAQDRPVSASRRRQRRGRDGDC
eukprot:767722-Hanusia_phi.AAC.4